MTDKPFSRVTDTIQLGVDGMVERDGILAVPAIIARNMVYDYSGTKVLKPFDELEAAAAFADGIPVTHTHPNAGIVTDRGEILGFLRNPLAENDELKGILEISDKDLIGDIKAGRIGEVSPGFFCTLDHTAGTLDDAEYDAVQRDILLNHVAVVQNGRCSIEDGCGLNLDSVDSPPDLIGKLDTAIGMATNEWDNTLRDLLMEVKEMIMAEGTTGDTKDGTDTELDALKKTVKKIEGERDSLKENLEAIIKVEKDAIIAELTEMQDAKKKEDLETLKLDELKKELEMVRELRTDRLTIKKPTGGRSAIDDAYAGIGRKP